MKSRPVFSTGVLAGGVIALLTACPVWAQNISNTRAVRLSFVEGNVTVLRPDVQTWAEAPVNTPLQEGFKLSTGESSFAELQFEKGDAIRVGQLTLLELTSLQLAPDGSRVNHAELRKGYATFHPLPSSPTDTLTVGTPYGNLLTKGEAKFRVDLDQGAERVEVFDGAVELQSNLGAMTLEGDAVLVLQPGAPDPSTLSQGITKDDWDQWVDDREARMDGPQISPSPNAYGGDAGDATYGWNDLEQYGSWSNVDGEGYGWSPNTVPAGWSPYSMGQWCWYPGWGYTWIGAEPWGWLPYHFGGWGFVPGRGWVWFPGGLQTWSPGLVTWYTGPNWVGWRPRPHRIGGSEACGNNCGGGVVSASTFQHGGQIASNLMLNINPTMGQMVSAPAITPALAAKLPGPAVTSPASHSPGSRGKPVRAAIGTSTMGARISTPEKQGPAAMPAHTSIVYDPQHNTYVNSNRVAMPHGSRTSPATALSPVAPGASPGRVEPVPFGGPQVGEQSREGPELEQPNPEGALGSIKPIPTRPRAGSPPSGNTDAYQSQGGQVRPDPRPGIGAGPTKPVQPPRPGNTPPTGNSYGGRPLGPEGPGGGNHVGGSGASAGGSSSSASGGGGHAGPAPSGGTAGAHH